MTTEIEKADYISSLTEIAGDMSNIMKYLVFL